MHEALALALAEALEAGLRIPCASGDDWLSDDATERADAAKRCAGCSCLTECAQAADSTKERWGVWAGVDRSSRPLKPRQLRTTATTATTTKQETRP